MGVVFLEHFSELNPFKLEAIADLNCLLRFEKNVKAAGSKADLCSQVTFPAQRHMTIDF